MRFLKVEDTMVNVNNITKIAIEEDSCDYEIVVYCELYDHNGYNKGERAHSYAKDIETYDEALKIFNELYDKLNS